MYYHIKKSFKGHVDLIVAPAKSLNATIQFQSRVFGELKIDWDKGNKIELDSYFVSDFLYDFVNFFLKLK